MKTSEKVEIDELKFIKSDPFFHMKNSLDTFVTNSVACICFHSRLSSEGTMELLEMGAGKGLIRFKVLRCSTERISHIKWNDG